LLIYLFQQSINKGSCFYLLRVFDAVVVQVAQIIAHSCLSFERERSNKKRIINHVFANAKDASCLGALLFVIFVAFFLLANLPKVHRNLFVSVSAILQSNVWKSKTLGSKHIKKY